MNAEQQIEIASKMYQSRRTLRRLFSSNYNARIVNYMRAISERSEKFGMPEMSAALQIAHGFQVAGYDMDVMWILAALVELLEPDELTPVAEGQR